MRQEQERVIVGVFDSAADAKQAIRELREAKFSARQIGVLSHGSNGEADVKSFRDLEGNHAAGGAAVGVAVGAGGGALWALGIAAGLLPAIGPVIGGGLLAAILASAAAGAGAGAIVGTLVGLGVDDEDAAYYDSEFRKGRTIVVVKDQERRTLVDSIFRAHRAIAREVVRPTLAEQLEGIRSTHSPASSR